MRDRSHAAGAQRFHYFVAFWILASTSLKASLVAAQSIDWDQYESGSLGDYPQTTFKTTNIGSPLVHVTKQKATVDDEYVLLAPQGDRIRANKALLLDQNGHAVWQHEERGTIKSFEVQTYRGDDYLTFWVGDDNFYGHGRGYYKMFDDTYTLARTVSALGGHEADYHEFTITTDDTALITAWHKTPWNLTHKGREDGYIWDCVFQEIDIENDELLFEWRASEHFTFNDMNVNSWANWTGVAADPWDWFHLNSVHKDFKGNFLIAGRYSNALSYIDGRTGEFLWHLGGRNNTFDDLSDGNATRFVDPHMARWTDTHSAIVLFDNVDFNTWDSPDRESRGLKIKVNPYLKTATAVTLLTHDETIFAQSEGSIQHLENGNYFIGYGSSSVWAEFGPDGQMVASANYAPRNISAERPQPGINTYRIQKHKWVGRPKQAPIAKFIGDRLYWSWNGATEVRSWVIDGGSPYMRRGERRWTSLLTIPRDDFEISMDVSGNYSFDVYKLTARGTKGQTLGTFLVEADGSVRVS